MTKMLYIVLAVLIFAAAPLSCRWSPVSDPLDPAWGGVLSLMPDPQQRNHWFIGTSLGLAESTDGGESFSFISNSLGCSFSTFLMDRDEPRWFWASFVHDCSPCSTTICRSTDRGFTWEVASEFEGNALILTQAFGYRETLLGYYVVGQACYPDIYYVMRSPDLGANWLGSACGIYGVRLLGAARSDMLYLLFEDYQESPDHAVLFRSADLGISWRSLISPFNFVETQNIETGGVHGDDLVILGCYDNDYSSIYCSTNQGDHWTYISGNSHDYHNPLTAGALLYSSSGDIYLTHPGATAPAIKRADATGTWLPACWDFPEDMGCNRLVSPWWDSSTVYTLMGSSTGVRLYRFSSTNSPPLIALAGWNPDFISAAAGGDVTITAYVVDPEDPLVTVELLYENMPTGIMLESVGGGLYEAAIHFPAGSVSPGYIMMELQATDPQGLTSMIWPFLRTGFSDEYPVVTPPAWNPDIAYYSGSSPRIIGGGWGFSGAVDAGFHTSTFVALAGKVNMVEIMWQALPTGMILEPYDQYNNNFNDFSAYFGTYGMALYTVGFPAGAYYLELQAHDSAGRRSGLWPYLTVTP